MPVYDYGCKECGSFTVFRPMSEYQLPYPCPGCGGSAERVLLSVPAFANMDSGRRNAMATNERSAHAPRQFNKKSGHKSDCGCCTGVSGRTFKAADGSKSFPSARPWMISH